MRAFGIARAGSIAENAELQVEEKPVVVWCESCGVETHAAVNALLCGRCRSWRVDLRSGGELLLKSVDLAVGEDGASSSAAA
jgi:hydrogenase nickel incorporation protein HypA/HybF